MENAVTETTTMPAAAKTQAVVTQWIYFFGDGGAEGRADMRDLLGGKGAGLAEMTNAGVPVPPGFTITTEVCRWYYSHGRQLPPDFRAQQTASLERLERVMGRKLGEARNPLLVSVRSGAKFSMPGMMDTILNLGLNDASVIGLAGGTGNERFAWDCYRRFIQMFASVVLDFEKREFEHAIEKLKQRRGVRLDTELTTADLKSLVARFKQLVRQRTGTEFPQDPIEQLARARDAVFRSWNNDRAVYYRRQNRIPDDLGTAVNVQAMVFGNLGETSGTGVGFTRNPSTGENHFYGEYLTNAQGEDVVAGVRTPQPIDRLEAGMPDVYRQLHDITKRLERHYRDVQDFEFTIQDGRLFLLQTRTGKRTAQAAVRIAVDMMKEGLISAEEAVLRVDPASLDQLLHPRFDPKARATVVATGLAASPGAAVGRAVFDADTAATRGPREPVILVRKETTPDDIHGMDAARGILTSTGGLTSHAAVVARGMGKPCVCGAAEVQVQEHARTCTIGKQSIREGDWLAIDGSTGKVMLGQVPTIEAEVSGEFGEFMAIADRSRRLKVRTNADTPKDSRKAIEFGAEGIGLCRSEHMFFGEERVPVVVRMILLAPEIKAGRSRLAELEHALADETQPAAKRRMRAEILVARRSLAKPAAEYKAVIAKLERMQRADYRGIFKAMDGYPVTIRTLDPPLHEFLPKREQLMLDLARLPRATAVQKRTMAKQYRMPVARLRTGLPLLLRRVEELHEFNPMLGHRGCRLGITYPEITDMQVRAIFDAACDAAGQGAKVLPEIMIPLVGTVEELRDQATRVREVAEAVLVKRKARFDYLVGTMIEVPRAAITADRIAAEAEFFSFGTNDLTQMTLGFSRDDAGRFLPEYVARKILPNDPFVSIDAPGVGALMQWAVERGRGARPGLKIGICGEHGGDPASVELCHAMGLDYVSCSPYRVPIARLAAAQAAVRGKAGSDQR